jgi:hypothetical protein
VYICVYIVCSQHYVRLMYMIRTNAAFEESLARMINEFKQDKVPEVNRENAIF